MKKALCIFLILMLCSCKSKPNEPIENFSQKPFESDIKISYNNNEFIAFLKYYGINNIVLTITSPDYINGLYFEKNNEDILAKYKNIEFPLISSENNFSIAEIAFLAIPKGLSQGVNENFETEINLEKVIFSFNNSAIKEIIIPERNLSLSFFNFKFI